MASCYGQRQPLKGGNIEMKKYVFQLIALIAIALVPALALANGAPPPAPQPGPVANLVWSIIYGLVGVMLLMIGYKIFEWITPFSVNDALAKDQNRAVGIVIGAIFIGIAIIVAAALG
jgi:putative membrane protein